MNITGSRRIADFFSLFIHRSGAEFRFLFLYFSLERRGAQIFAFVSIFGAVRTLDFSIFIICHGGGEFGAMELVGLLQIRTKSDFLILYENLQLDVTN